MFIFLGIALFKDLFSLIVGADFREGIFILPVVLGANVLSGVWLNLSFWYKREERTQLAVWVTFTGLFFTVVMNVALVPALGYVGAAWARLASEAAMVGVSYWLNRRYTHALRPAPYRRVCRAGAGRFLRQCGFRALAPRARRGICGERRVVRSVRPVRRAARAYRRGAAVAIGRETMN